MKKQKFILCLKSTAAVLIIALHIAPFYIMLNMSLKGSGERSSRWLPPVKPDFMNYLNAAKSGGLLHAMGNTLTIVFFAVTIIVLVGAMAAYPLARKETKWNKGILAFAVGIMMVPSLSVLVPLYKELVSMGGVNRLWGIIVVSATFNLPMSIYMYCNFIHTVPKELDEAAMIDGCSRTQVFFRIILPSLKATTASVIIWTSVGIWNDYSFQLYFLQKPSVRTVTLAITTFFTESRTDMGAAAAAAFIAVLPPIVMYVILQKHFVRGAMDSAVK